MSIASSCVIDAAPSGTVETRGRRRATTARSDAAARRARSGNSSGRAERVVAALDTSVGTPAPSELVEPGLLRLARRVQREATAPGSRRPELPAPYRQADRAPALAAADDDRRAGTRSGVTAARSPTSRVAGAGRDLPAGPPPRLLDQHHGDALRGEARSPARSRSRASMPPPAPWLSRTASAIGRVPRARVTSRPSPSGVGDDPVSALAHRRTPRAGIGSTSSGPLLRTLPTAVDTG